MQKTEQRKNLLCGTESSEPEFLKGFVNQRQLQSHKHKTQKFHDQEEKRTQKVYFNK